MKRCIKLMFGRYNDDDDEEAVEEEPGPFEIDDCPLVD